MVYFILTHRIFNVSVRTVQSDKKEEVSKTVQILRRIKTSHDWFLKQHNRYGVDNTIHESWHHGGCVCFVFTVGGVGVCCSICGTMSVSLLCGCFIYV